MPSQNTLHKLLETIIGVITRSQKRSNDTPAARKNEFEQSIEQLTSEEQTNACVYIYDNTYGWVLVKSGFTREEAEMFAEQIINFNAFGSSVSPLDVIVTSHPPRENVVTYEDVYNELPAPIKSGVKNALADFLEN